MMYYGAICVVLAWGAPLLETAFRRVLLGLSTGILAAALLPFVRAYFG